MGRLPTVQRPINRLLIANRGEIACRIARTAHRLGMSTVGVYSEADRNALHVDSVEVAVALGGATAAESYLRGDAIVAAALRTGADAIHPGYGFLAENPEFAEAVTAAGLIWVGPTPEQIRLLGDKIAAKRAALAAGVPTTPIVTIDDGVWNDPLPPFPLLVKAAAGGGGRGMRVVAAREGLAEAVASASREAAAAFGDGTVFIEPYLARGRHVEVQIMGDVHGNVVHLGERECSIQRRNQKIVEESPSPGITDAARTALHDGAVALAKHVGYVGAGTVEFMVGEPDPVTGATLITFLEVNTRLQVEHPVTEAVTGLDLVELQLMVAQRNALTFTQDDVTISGHAIEVRVVAEDPAAGWLPSVGTLTEFSIGSGLDGVRVDTGFRAGSEVSGDYDSMLAKVIGHHEDRRVAAAQVARALRTGCVAGVRTNIASLIEIMGETDFLAGDTPTAYLAEHPHVSTASGPTGDDRLAHVVAAVFALEQRHRAADDVTGFAPSGWRNLRTQGQRRSVVGDGVAQHVEYVLSGSSASVLVGAPPAADDRGELPPDGRRRVAVRLLVRSAGRQVLEVDGIRHDVRVRVDGTNIVTSSAAGVLEWSVPPKFDEHHRSASHGGPVSPLPGTVIAVHVAVGDEVTEGQLLMAVEAMKMEHQITAGADATVSEVRFAVGDRVDQGDLLVALEATE
jgi:propionyl-CoA carboxylase alpha chain